MVAELYADEEVKSIYRYPNGFKVKHLTEQLDILCRGFPELGHSFQIYDQKFPMVSDGQFVIPKWNKVASSYAEAVNRVLGLIWSKREMYNYLRDCISDKYLRQHPHTVAVWEKEEFRQPGNVFIFPAQFGLMHCGRSVRRARAVFEVGESGLGVFAVGCMLLTHPERLGGYELWIDCAGDEFLDESSPDWVKAPFFRYDCEDGQMELGARWARDPDANYGSATGFLF